jgi:hypothetical protein
MQRVNGIVSMLYIMSILVIALLSPSQFAKGQDVIQNNSPVSSMEEEKVFQPKSKPYNLTYGEWTARWWQWAYSIPREMNPAYDDTGKYCSVNQLGPVWFFPGTYCKSVIRECTVPIGKSILFPILNSECSFAEFPDLKTVEELRICANTFQDQVIQLRASIDGHDIPEKELEMYRVQSLPFYFMLPENNILDLPANTVTQAVSDGNWVFVKPFSPGKHEISFRGEVNVTSNDDNSTQSFAFPTGWDYNTTYELLID